MDLASKKCVPCRGGEPTLNEEEAMVLLKELPAGWEVTDENKKLVREWEFTDFKEAIDFINKVADIAEKENHHPNVCLFDYKKVRLELWTHKIGGLHENDFILASKIAS